MNEIEEIKKEILLDMIYKEFSVTENQLISKNRKRHIADARHIFCYCWKKIAAKYYSLKRIGKSLGGRDHSTILHSIKIVENTLITMDEFKVFIENYKEAIGYNVEFENIQLEHIKKNINELTKNINKLVKERQLQLDRMKNIKNKRISAA